MPRDMAVTVEEMQERIRAAATMFRGGNPPRIPVHRPCARSAEEAIDFLIRKVKPASFKTAKGALPTPVLDPILQSVFVLNSYFAREAREAIFYGMIRIYPPFSRVHSITWKGVQLYSGEFLTLSVLEKLIRKDGFGAFMRVMEAAKVYSRRHASGGEESFYDYVPTPYLHTEEEER